jgi:hypothetical protein
LPFDFVATGVPISKQSTVAAAVERWQQVVTEAARTAVPRRRGGYSPAVGELEATVVYFYRTPPLDTDNMIKPILDAIKGIVYADDGQIVDLHAGVRALSTNYDFEEATDVLWLAYEDGEPFVYVRIQPLADPLEALP